MEGKNSRAISATLKTVPTGKYHKVQTEVMSNATQPEDGLR